MKRVTGLGGFFFKSENPTELKSWYHTHLGLDTTDWGCSFRWLPTDKPDATTPASTEWSPMPANTDYFAPSEKQFMINYRVENLEALLQVLQEEGVTIVGEMQSFSYGKFAWVLDPEGNKIELWEPIDDGF